MQRFSMSVDDLLLWQVHMSGFLQVYTAHLSLVVLLLCQMTDVDIYTAAMDATLSTAGGFCAGNHDMCNHQRLSGQGYCFSGV